MRFPRILIMPFLTAACNAKRDVLCGKSIGEVNSSFQTDYFFINKLLHEKKSAHGCPEERD